ncbi:hypothetical protein WHR41_04606 [Cladosporium halotolerans]|uniref:CCZ1/INTU/HSP4 first Longin domain-containing protein n=1 Tax=Cladosporium halotolerans TaxID=1052096 RepID=A0AB34KPU3_9PEZI
MTTTHKYHASSVTPAQLSFLAIYNPTLGPTDETFADQLVFWYSRKTTEARRAEKSGDAGSEAKRKAAEREDENERLRQIGLAQGMVGFAKTFSEGEQPVDSVETEKSRVVLRELERGWWILASIDLTRLPAPATGAAGKSEANAKPALEYSSREVSSPALLIQQLLQAHWVFLLHHGPTLDELFVRLSREKFCSTLERYWTRFARSWDVLLHGNPAVDVLGGVKLAAGGELGVGVGEEEWGSGEREVLEGMTRRTEGLVDMVVARFGEPTTERDENSVSEMDEMPWLGSGNLPSTSDGIVFSGLDELNRNSLRSISLWMRQIYTYGEQAYGVRDNPHRERRKRRRRNPPPQENASSTSSKTSRQVDARDLRQRIQAQEAARSESPTIDPALLPKDPRPQMYDRVASHDHATGTSTPQSASHPNIPPPIVSAAEQALNKATKNADQKSTRDAPEESEDGTTMGIPDQYMKYMTFGLSSLAKSYTKKQSDTPKPSADNSKASKPSEDSIRKSKAPTSSGGTTDDKAALSHIDPVPEGEEMRNKLALQVRGENQGGFVVGLTGDLSADENEEDDDASITEGSSQQTFGGRRTLVRTVQIEIAPKKQTYAEKVDEDLAREDGDGDTGHLMPENPVTKNFRRLRVLIYVRRPFMFAFLFEQRTPSLSYSGLYKSLHNTLKPIHKRLLASTSPETVAQRLLTHHPHSDSPIFSIIHDPVRLSTHSSLPNIPNPGAYDPWTRLEALNVHASILASLAATSGPKGDTALERTSKTSRSWWVVWLRLPPSVAQDDAKPDDGSTVQQSEENAGSNQVDSQGGPRSTLGLVDSIIPAPRVDQTHRVAILVRKADDSASGPTQTKASVGSRMGSGMWSSLGMRGASSSNAAGGNGEASGAVGGLGGFGVDARRYVEGLLSLNR